MKGLKVVLWICAVLFLLSFIVALLPWQTIISLYKVSGVQPPTTETMDTMIFRLCLLTYGAIGIFFLLLAQKPLNYGVMLPLAAYCLIGLGLAILGGGLRYGLPLWAYARKAVLLALLGGLVLFFRRQAKGGNKK